MLRVRLVIVAVLTACLTSLSTFATGQSAKYEWKARWITHPTAPLREPIVLHFRKTISLPSAPAKFIVRVSADNRFVLYVNGKRAGDGPARGDLDHWRYQRIDIGPYLTGGENRITATVWNFGVFAPIAQISDRTAFLLEGESDAAVANTGPGWQVEAESGQQAYPREPGGFWEYFACGPGERVYGDKYDWDWQTPVSRGLWVEAASPMRENASSGVARDADSTSDTPWGLVPDTLPHMTYEATDLGHVVRSGLQGAAAFPAQPVTVPPNSKVYVLLDRGTLITASMEGIIAVGKMAGKSVPAFDRTRVPNATYCEPQIGSIGLTERQAREAGHTVKIGKFPFAANSKASILGRHEGFVKVVAEEKYGEILGVHIIGPLATEILAESVAALQLEATIDDMMFAVHAHPTLWEAMGDAFASVRGLAINI